MGKLTRLHRENTISTATWDGSTLTIVTDNLHYLKSGDLVTLTSAKGPENMADVAVTVIDTTTFTVNDVTGNNRYYTFFDGIVKIGYYSDGQTGDQTPFRLSRSTEAPAVLQFTSYGAGTAELTLHLSNDQVGWVLAATVTLAAENLSTEFATIAPNWSWGKLGVTSIGANTTVVATLSA